MDVEETEVLLTVGMEKMVVMIEKEKTNILESGK